MALELFDGAMQWIVRLLELAGVGVIVAGSVAAAASYLRRRLSAPRPEEDFRIFRSAMGRAILIGLEFLIAADIIRTITTDLSLQSIVSLGGLILIRILLSLALEVEIEGTWPWRRREIERGDAGPR